MLRFCFSMPCFILSYPKDLTSTIPIISFGLRIIVSLPAFLVSKIALLCINFNFISKVLLVPPCIILIIAKPEMSSTNGAQTFTNFCSLHFNISSFSGYMGTDLFKNSNLQSLEFIIPSNSNTFFMPKTKSTFSCILDTRV